MNADPKGYYAVLGVHPSASSRLIEQAYRVRRGELHPDLNKSESATRDFQLLEEAKRVLSDPQLRAAYDTSGLGPSAASPGTQRAPETAEPEPQTYQRLEPVVCSRCGAISAVPRYRVYYLVYSFLYWGWRKPFGGIFCAKCEAKTAAMATGGTLLLAWWGVVGWIWAWEALYKNLFAAFLFQVEDARLMGHQAIYFAQGGKADLAHAIASRALKIASGNHKKSAAQLKREKLGYETDDPLRQLIDAMKALLQATPGSTLELRHTSRILNPTFGVQAALVGAAVIGVMTLIGINAARESARQEQQAQMERDRLEREGIAREQAAAIAAKQAEELKKLREPLPNTGLLRNLGLIDPYMMAEQLPGLKVVAPQGANYLVKLEDWVSGAPQMLIFVRAGETAIVPVPFGNYRIKIASGQTWYGETVRFGPDTEYGIFDKLADFKLVGDQLLGHELTLTRTPGGNLAQRKISSGQF